MAQHPRSWLRNTLNVWLGYFLTAIAAIPASALGLFLISNGVGQQAAIIISLSLAVLGGFIAEQLIALWSRKQKRLLVSASPDIAYQPRWVRTADTASGFIEGLSQTTDSCQRKTIISSMFVVTEKQKNDVPVKDRKQPQKRTGNEPIEQSAQFTQAAALPYFERLTARAG